MSFANKEGLCRPQEVKMAAQVNGTSFNDTFTFYQETRDKWTWGYANGTFILLTGHHPYQEGFIRHTNWEGSWNTKADGGVWSGEPGQGHNDFSATIYAGAGNDVISGTNAYNLDVYGEEGNDTITGYHGTIDGGADHDEIYAYNATVFGGTGSDTITASNSTVYGDLIGSGAGDDTINAHNSTVYSGAGEDWISVSDNNHASSLFGDGGVDILDLSQLILSTGAGATIDLRDSGGLSRTHVFDDNNRSITYKDFEAVIGTRYADHVTMGDYGKQFASTGGGNDTIIGSDGSDYILSLIHISEPTRPY